MDKPDKRGSPREAGSEASASGSSSSASSASSASDAPAAPVRFGASGRGRPTKLTPEFQEKFLQMLRDGKPISPSLEVCGVEPSTFRKWRAMAAKSPAEHPDLAEFLSLVARARSEGEIGHWTRATKGDPAGVSNGPAKCAQWALERQYGPKYAPRVAVKVEAELESFLDVVQGLCGEKACGCYEQILEALAARERGDAAEGPDATTGDIDPVAAIH